METPTRMELVLAAQMGDQAAFDSLVQPYQRELLVHCYRMLGSLHDAEDLVQETLLRAWEKRATFTHPQSYRAWLYRIATNLCLNTLTCAPARSLPSVTHPQLDPTRPLPQRQREPTWLEPFPDDLLADPHSDPEQRVLQSEHITLVKIRVSRSTGSGRLFPGDPVAERYYAAYLSGKDRRWDRSARQSIGGARQVTR